ncbi:hypothetical protein IMCC3317_30670 [Kordia antarctica]|uniref:Uncharacterized protein n=1 Tax=Kordia antarctica TaxID=1218801 RepID=A0A7L4ZNB7_9FLAO|nr:hypothetical protein IMCC3317_30670 [Kordia antarctica]
MCEKCTPSKIHETHLAKDLKPFQKKLNIDSLKGKSKKVKTN